MSSLSPWNAKNKSWDYLCVDRFCEGPAIRWVLFLVYVHVYIQHYSAFSRVDWQCARGDECACFTVSPVFEVEVKGLPDLGLNSHLVVVVSQWREMYRCDWKYLFWLFYMLGGNFLDIMSPYIAHFILWPHKCECQYRHRPQALERTFEL